MTFEEILPLIKDCDNYEEFEQYHDICGNKSGHTSFWKDGKMYRFEWYNSFEPPYEMVYTKPKVINVWYPTL